jgi:RimJ/RimL family protein N-acetyltransferase
MIKVVDYQPEHSNLIEKSQNDPDVDAGMFMGQDRSQLYAKLGKAITMMDDDKVLAIGGVVNIWEGVGEIWMIVSDDGRKKEVGLYKTMKDFIDSCFLAGYHRIETSIVDRHRTAHRCILRLGFIPEGMMVMYGPHKENFVRYVRFN